MRVFFRQKKYDAICYDKLKHPLEIRELFEITASHWQKLRIAFVFSSNILSSTFFQKSFFET